MKIIELYYILQVIATISIPFIAIGITEILKRRRHTRKYKYKYKYSVPVDKKEKK